MDKVLVVILLGSLFLVGRAWAGENITLLAPKRESSLSLEEALFRRRSVRSFQGEPLLLEELAQLVFAACGITEELYGFRTAPSAGALYPLELLVVVGKVEGLSPGIYRYLPQKHQLEKLLSGDRRAELCQAALSQGSIREAPVVLVIAAEYEKTTRRYGERGIRYVHMEAGHVGQNIYLQAESLGLGTVAIGAFQDQEVARALNLPPKLVPLYIFPVGKPRE
ncbi:MAG: SagB/ThcOx family dehydrogenase [Candidatus Caldatribacteriaceae bacterium]